MQVVLKAGDILYIPQHWWHHVRSFDCPNIAISLWFHPFAEKEEEQSSLEDDSADVRITICLLDFSHINTHSYWLSSCLSEAVMYSVSTVTVM